MPLSKQDKDYHFPDITTIEPKSVDVDRVFTNLLPLLKYEGSSITRKRGKFVTLDDLTDVVCHDDTFHFDGFTEHRKIVSRWLESDFLSLVHRGKVDKQQIAAPLPMHLNTYKLRNAKHCRDYGVAEQIFSFLYYGAPDVMKELRDFLFLGADYYTDKYDGQTDLDIETLLMMRILEQAERDHEDKRKTPKIYQPLYIGQAYLLGDDIARLLAYQHVVPRLVLIEYIKNIMALHVSLYMLRLFQIVPDFVERGQLHPNCLNPSVQRDSMGLFLDEPVFPVHLIVDMGEDYHSHIAELARHQFNAHIEQLNTYMRAHLTLKKLQEFAYDLKNRGYMKEPFTLEQILALRNYKDPLELKTFFEIRIRSLMATDNNDPDERLAAIRKLGLPPLETYIEMLYLLRHSFLRRFYFYFLDAIFQKNRETGLLRQGYGKINTRRYSLGSGLLETLVQIAVLESEHNTFRTRTIRVDDFIDWLQKRYGIYISRLPDNYTPSIADLEALRLNVQAFKTRLREIGFYTDLSDAYVSQVIRPRYHIH
jgi:hypothetical protein